MGRIVILGEIMLVLTSLSESLSAVCRLHSLHSLHCWRKSRHDRRKLVEEDITVLLVSRDARNTHSDI